MKKATLLLLLFWIPCSLFAQIIEKPIGCFAGTNGTNPAVLAHPDARGVLLTEKWSNIEPSPGVFDFTALNNKINVVNAAGQKYALAIAGGAFGSPSWLIDSLNVDFFNFQYQSQNFKLPLWWDSICKQRLETLIQEIGTQYASDSMLSHVYVTQMTVNGVEGHLNGVDMPSFTTSGYTAQKWISSAKSTTLFFANAFPDKPIVFEVHEIDHDTLVPSIIMNELSNDPNLCKRIGLGMWWISGKTTYQADLIEYISNFQGDKYAQIIGRSDQLERFKDSLYSTVFAQAKNLGIRYIEPWPYEFQYQPHDSLIQDFNSWADANFSISDTCSFLGMKEEVGDEVKINVYPNPIREFLMVEIDQTFENIEIIICNMEGKEIMRTNNSTQIDVSQLPNGLYVIHFIHDGHSSRQKVVKLD